MNIKNSTKICDAAPSLFYREGKEGTAPIPFFFECGDGWSDLLLEAAIELNNYIKTLPDDAQEDIVVMQVKEKYGTLRFYVSYCTEEIDSIIKKAEKRSCTTCETCGKEGTLRGSVWLYTACDEHTRPEDLEKGPQKDLA